MKQLVILTMAAAATGMQAQITETATEAVKNMGVGWNLGNTLDASGNNRSANPADALYWGGQGLESETYWGQPYTRAALMQMMKNAGFGAIRVPVTWYNHMSPDGKVDTEWMNRVHEVVDYVIDNGMYCIVNVHHDTGADSNSHTSWLKADEQWYADQQARFESLWTQIAEEFRDYDEHLLFAGYNEMLDVKSSWCFASFAAAGNYDAQIAASAYNGINSYAQSFVNAVRATGGNNATRNLVVPTYAACCGSGTWNSHLSDPLTQMQLPTDAEEGHLIFEVHAYPQIAEQKGNTVSDRSMSSIKADVDQIINAVKTHLMSKGAPVIVGEWGTSNVDAGNGKTDYEVRRELMMQFVDYFVTQTKENGMGTFYWMGLSDGNYRSMPLFNQADLAERIVKAYHGEDFVGEYPVVEESTSIVAFEGEKELGWGQGWTIGADILAMVGKNAQVEMTYTLLAGSDNDDIQFFDGWWQAKPKFTVEGTRFDGDFQPSTFYGMNVGEEKTTVFNFDEATLTTLSQRGLIVHGYRIKLTKIVVSDSTQNAIEQICCDADGIHYDLMGRRLPTSVPGLQISGDRKLMLR